MAADGVFVIRLAGSGHVGKFWSHTIRGDTASIAYLGQETHADVVEFLCTRLTPRWVRAAAPPENAVSTSGGTVVVRSARGTHYRRAPGQRHCKYGAKCYRKNPKHFEEEDHPAEHPLIARGAPVAAVPAGVPGKYVRREGMAKMPHVGKEVALRADEIEFCVIAEPPPTPLDSRFPFVSAAASVVLGDGAWLQEWRSARDAPRGHAFTYALETARPRKFRTYALEIHGVHATEQERSDWMQLARVVFLDREGRRLDYHSHSVNCERVSLEGHAHTLLAEEATPKSATASGRPRPWQVDGKWCTSLSFFPNGTPRLEFRFATPVAIGALVLTTADDHAERDPSRFSLYGVGLEAAGLPPSDAPAPAPLPLPPLAIDRSDEQTWIKVLEYAQQPYAPTVAAVGELVGVGEMPRGFAKLSDEAINHLVGCEEYYLRLQVILP